MLVFWKEKLVLLAVPKTGTSALEAAFSPLASTTILFPPGLKHGSARLYLRQMQPWVTRDGKYPHETMAIIREPVDWLGSWYRYRQRKYVANTPTSTRGMEFSDFVQAWLDPKPPEFARIGSQSAFLCDAEGRLLVDHLYRYEDFDQALGFLNMRLGTDLTPPRVNVSPRMGLSLSEEVQELLEASAKRDFDLWRSAAPPQPSAR